jgi:hypothetical protein
VRGSSRSGGYNNAVLETNAARPAATRPLIPTIRLRR